jgi:hypothetical protein
LLSTCGLVFTVVVVILVMAAVPAGAQILLAEDMASGASAGLDRAMPGTPAMISPSPLPDAPAPYKVIDKKFVAVMAALGGAESLRIATHKLILDHEYAAGAPWVTSVPKDKDLIAKNGAIFGAEFLVAYELKKPHSWLPGDSVIRKFWWAYPAAMAAIHIKSGIGNIRTDSTNACPPIYCGAQ